MPDTNDKNKHPSAPQSVAGKPVSAERKKPQAVSFDYTRDEDFSELEERFSGHSRNKYYAKVSTGYRNVKLLLVVLLTAVIAFALVLGADNFTYSNLRYLLRNFGEADSGDTERAALIEYHGSDSAYLGIYGGKLAVADSDSVELYRTSGKKIYEISTELSDPIITCGGKYFFVWKCGESDISVFNAVSRVGTLDADGPIYAVSADKQGSFAVLYKDRVYNSAVAVYDADLRKKATKSLPQDNAVDVALSYDGGMLYTISFTADGGDYVTNLDFSDINGGTVEHTYKYTGEFPLKVGAFAGGGCYAVTDKAVYVYSSDGGLVRSEKLDQTVYRIMGSDSCVCVVLGGSGAGGSVIAISESGELAADFALDGAVLDGCITDDGLFLLSSSLVLVSLEDGSKQLVGKFPNALGLISDGTAVYCVYTGKAELVFLDGKPYTDAETEQNSANN